MNDDAATGCAVIAVAAILAPFVIAAVPVLAGIACGIFFIVVIVPIVAAILAGILNIFK